MKAFADIESDTDTATTFAFAVSQEHNTDADAVSQVVAVGHRQRVQVVLVLLHVLVLVLRAHRLGYAYAPLHERCCFVLCGRMRRQRYSYSTLTLRTSYARQLCSRRRDAREASREAACARRPRER